MTRSVEIYLICSGIRKNKLTKASDTNIDDAFNCFYGVETLVEPNQQVKVEVTTFKYKFENLIEEHLHSNIHGDQ